MSKFNRRKKLWTMDIEHLQTRIRELEQRSSLRFSLQTDCKNDKETNRLSLLALPITYTPVQGSSTKLEIIPYSSKNQPAISFLFVEQSKDQMYEIVVKCLNLEYNIIDLMIELKVI
jgi:hypothetical protein